MSSHTLYQNVIIQELGNGLHWTPECISCILNQVLDPLDSEPDPRLKPRTNGTFRASFQLVKSESLMPTATQTSGDYNVGNFQTWRVGCAFEQWTVLGIPQLFPSGRRSRCFSDAVEGASENEKQALSAQFGVEMQLLKDAVPEVGCTFLPTCDLWKVSWNFNMCWTMRLIAINHN